MAGYSRLMENDENSIISRQKDYRKNLIDPAIETSGGHIVKTTGDGMLVDFSSAQSAVRCALEIQAGMQERESGRPDKERIQYRVGINVGDVVFDDGDVFGDGVNVASRLEGLAEPGGICISDSVHQMVQDRIPERFDSLGLQKVKNISRPIKVWQWTSAPRERSTAVTDVGLTQRIEFCIAPDGTQLAYASIGEGPPVLKAPNWLNHIEYEWRSPIWGPALSAMAEHHRLVRFDQRGNGLSDWDVQDVSEDVMIADMETVATAAGLERTALFGISQGCAFSIRYAVEHPGKVICLVLLGGYARGTLMRNSPEQQSLHEAMTTMIRQAWGSPNPVYRHLFTESLMADATAEQKSSFDELQRVATSPENAARINEMNAAVDVTELAPQIKVPTLVLHSEGDRRVPLEEGRRMAALIPGARFVTLPGNNHALVEGTSAFDMFFEEFERFLNEHCC
jgi:class 3 adenylate cyclase/pimeloyl-ACP methyl ester carboxylesterase